MSFKPGMIIDKQKLAELEDLLIGMRWGNDVEGFIKVLRHDDGWNARERDAKIYE